MNNTTAADLGTAIVIYQSVLELLDAPAAERLSKYRLEKFDKFKSRGEEIDAMLNSATAAIEENCETFCRLALDGIVSMLEEQFPLEENAPE